MLVNAGADLGRGGSAGAVAGHEYDIGRGQPGARQPEMFADDAPDAVTRHGTANAATGQGESDPGVA